MNDPGLSLCVTCSCSSAQFFFERFAVFSQDGYPQEHDDWTAMDNFPDQAFR